MKRGILFKIITSFFLVLLVYRLPAAETYSLDDCIETALKNNYGIVAAKNSYDAARGEVYTAWGGLLPTISISANGSRNWPIFARFDESSGQIISGRDRFSSSLNFSNSFPGMGLYNYANIKKKRNDRNSSFYYFVKSQKDLILGVKGYYYDLLKSKMLLEVAEEAVKRGEERLRVVQSRYDLGSASMSDVLKAKVRYGSDRLDLVSKSNIFKLAKAQLAYTMGIDVNNDFEVDENLPERDIDISFEGGFSEALSGNPEYRKAIFDLSSAKNSKTMAYSNFLPTLSLGLSHSSNVYEFSQFTEFKQANASSFMYASLSFNIFNGTSDYATLLAAKKNVDTNNHALKDTKNRVALEVKQAFLDIEQSNEARKLADESVAAAQEDLNLVKEKYNLGAATILEVLDAEVSLKQAQTSKVQAIFDNNLAISKLEKVLGR
ncbi:MAG: TolC family protein [candidate division Zixibacteria bacterium]